MTRHVNSVVMVISVADVTAADGCLDNSPDTAEFSREFQQHQHLFDPEHDYPALAKWVSENNYPLGNWVPKPNYPALTIALDFIG